MDYFRFSHIKELITNRSLIWFLTASFLITGTACKELLDVKRTFTFEQEFTIIESESTSFSELEIVNMAAAQSLIAEYGEKIKKIEIQELKYWLKNYEGPDGQTLINLDFDVARMDGTNVTNILSINDVVLAGLVNNPTVANVNNEGIAFAGELIKTPPHNLWFQVSGNLNEGPISFTMAFEFKIQMTANPLSK